MKNQVVPGQRVILRPITREDTDMVLAWRNAERTRENFYYRKVITREEHLAWLRGKVEAGLVHQFIVCLKDSGADGAGEPIGCVYLQHFDPSDYSMESGVFFSEDAPAGQGLASEAVRLLNFEVGFRRLGLCRTVARVLSYNEASRHVHENAGFALEEVRERDALLDGTWRDTCVYRCYNPEYHVPCVYGEIQSGGKRPFAQGEGAGCTSGDGIPVEAVPEEVLSAPVPGSKSVTNRALLLALLADGTSCLSGVLFSDDSRHFLKCVQELGFETAVDEEARTVRIRGLGGAFPKREASVYVGSAGTAARFLTAVLGVTEGTWHFDASEQMRKRPMEPLLRSLQELGCEISYPPAAESEASIPGSPGGSKDTPDAPSCAGSAREWHFPYILRGHGFAKNDITVDIDKSSQFLSALLIASVLAPEGLRVRTAGSHGMAYVRMTAEMMRQFGAVIEMEKAEAENPRIRGSLPDGKETMTGGTENAGAAPAFYIPAGQRYRARSYAVEPDASAAAYFYAMCPLLGIPVCIPGVRFGSLQGDTEFLRVLERMGCRASENDAGDIRLDPPADGVFCGGAFDLSACSDQALTLAAIAPFADSPVTITGIGHIRLQECDRLSAMEAELGRMGIRTEATADAITIYPGAPRPAKIETYDDHRVAMSFALTGLRAEGITIKNPSCCRKTFENYFAILQNLFPKEEVSRDAG